jgi:uncharacterized protein (TIGR03066 family)
MRTLIGTAVVLAACGLAVADDKKDERFDAAKLVGKWEPKEAKKGEEFELEFTKDGKVTVKGTLDGKPQTLEGVYTLAGDKLSFEVKAPGEVIKETIVLAKLTDDEFEGRDKEGRVEVLKRVKPKK